MRQPLVHAYVGQLPKLNYKKKAQTILAFRHRYGGVKSYWCT